MTANEINSLQSEENTVTALQRTRSFVKTSFTRVGVPLLIGTAVYFAYKKLDLNPSTGPTE